MSRLKQGRDILRNCSICLDQRQACPTRRERNIPEGLVCRRGRQFTRFKRLTLWRGGGGPRTSDEDKDGVPRTSGEDKDGVPRPRMRIKMGSLGPRMRIKMGSLGPRVRMKMGSFGPQKRMKNASDLCASGSARKDLWALGKSKEG